MNTLIGIMALVIVLLIAGRIINRIVSFSGRRAWLLIGGYLLLLVITVPLIYLVPEARKDVRRSEVVLQAERANNAFISAIQQGRLPPLEHMHELSSWSFRYGQPELKLRSFHWEERVQVLVKRNPSLGQEIRLTWYSTPYLLLEYPYDFTHLLALPEVELSDDTLIIRNLEMRMKKELIHFLSESHMHSFTGEDRRIYGPSVMWGQECLYLEVPEHLRISASDVMNLIFVEE